MRKLVTLICLGTLLVACESLYEDDGIPRINSQRDADAYNATVSGESQKLVCARESVIGSNIRQFVCMTVAQREMLARQAREDIQRRGAGVANE